MEHTEKVYLRQSPSQMVNIGHFAGAFLLIATAIFVAVTSWPYAMVGAAMGIAYAIWRYLVVQCTVYEITSERIKHRHGVLNKTVNEMELYRVRDYQVQQPFWLRLVGCGNVVLVSSDRTTGQLVLWAQHDSEKIANTIRKLVEQSRRARGVRDMEVGSAPLVEE